MEEEEEEKEVVGRLFGMQIWGIMWDFAAPDFDGWTLTGVHR